MLTKPWFIAFLLGSVVACVGALESPNPPKGSREISKRNFDAVWQYRRPAIYSSDKAVRLYYRTECHASKNVSDAPVPFPVVKVQPPSEGKAGFAAVREIFQKDENVTVMEDPLGIIRIWIGKVPTEILQTQLSLVTLNSIAQYNPDDALAAILNAKEMEAAMRSLGFSPPVSLAGTVAEPADDLPQLPASMKNLSVDQALDEIAKTWAGEGIVIYGVCDKVTEEDGSKLFSLDYAGDVVPKVTR